MGKLAMVTSWRAAATRWKATLLLAGGLAMSGCFDGGGGGGGGGGGVGTPPPPPPPPPPPVAVTIEGRVIDAPVPFADVLISLGGAEFTGQADENGNYSITITSEELEAMVVAVAADPDNELIQFVSLLGSFARLVSGAGDDGILTRDENNQVNITNLSTAQFVLLTEAAGGAIESEEMLAAAAASISLERMLELAAIIKLVVDGGKDLPAGVTNVLELVSDPEAVAAFKADSVTPEELAAAIEELTDPELNPELVAQFRAERLPQAYFMVPRSAPGTIRWAGGRGVIEFGPEGSATFMDMNSNDNPAASWSIAEDTGVLTVAIEEPLVTESFFACPQGGQVRMTQRVTQLDLRLLGEGPVLDLLQVSGTLARTFPDGIPQDCAAPAASEPFSFNTVAFRAGAGELPYDAEALEGRTLALHRLDEREGILNLIPWLTRLDAGGEGVRTLWAPDPGEIQVEDVTWSVEQGQLVVTDADGGERYTYVRLQRDGRGGEGVYALLQRGTGRAAAYWTTVEVDPEVAVDDPVALIGHWRTASEISRPADELQPLVTIRLRLCNDVAPTEENTGPLYGTGVQVGVVDFEETGGAPLSWGFDEHDNLVLRRYTLPGFGPVSYCDPATQPGCTQSGQRSFLPLRVSEADTGDRMYVLEDLWVGVPVFLLTRRLNWLEQGECSVPQ